MKPSLRTPQYKNIPIFFECGPKRIPTIFLKNIYNQRVLLDPADYFITCHYIECLDWEDHLETPFSESLSKGGLYIDIGANIGIHVLRAKRLGAQSIIAFEPNPNTFQILKLNTEINGIPCSIIESAISDHTGSSRFNSTNISAGMAHLTDSGKNTITVTTETISNYFNNNPNIEKLALVKIDIEGHEGEAIYGALDYLKQHNNFNIIMEFQSESSINGVNILAKVFNLELWCYRWMKSPFQVDIGWINDKSVRVGCDLYIKCSR